MRTTLSSVRPGPTTFLLLLALALSVPAAAQVSSAKKKAKDKEKKSGDATTSLTIRVVGQESGKPIANASVYLRFKEKEAMLFLLHKKHKVELDLKTDDKGSASFAEVPQGKLLIQVVAPLWQTFGEYYKLDQAKRTIVIKLHRPKTRWY